MKRLFPRRLKFFVEVDGTKAKLIGQSKVEKRGGKWILTYGKASTY
ncbi:MAG: hypothetical protein IJS81_08940 [Selenomonadaceae bacterium]|nr:hypothetical protein [Selenomonadaceae bacterium]MBQ7630318.1 hypothetical protein [Selenomonadaceae bacterium]